MLALNKFRKEDETGFTLIELLVVILIIGILAAIAVPMFINQRKSAVDASVQSDVRNAASVVETALIPMQGAKTAVGAALVSGKATTSPGNLLAYSGDSDGYCITGTNPGGDVAANSGFAYASADAGVKTLDDTHICQAGKIIALTKPTPPPAPLPAGAHSWSGSVQLVNRSLGVVADATLTAYTLSGESKVRINIVRADGTPVATNGDQFQSYLNFKCTDATINGDAAYGGVTGAFVDNKTSTTTNTFGTCVVTRITLLDNAYDQDTDWGLVSQLDVPLS